ncbi:peptidylprolyl isomerase [Candidatus Bathyarchaeota archaeon]|nr:peptidylprolyl isomerase [Candidatus Bathyarchaeota archaeon]
MPINDGDKVTIHYTAKLDNGEVVEDTHTTGPITFNVGEGRLLPRLEEALKGLEKGDRKEVTLSPEESFGEWKEDNLQEVPRSMLAGGFDPFGGDVVELRYVDGSRRLVTVEDVKEDSIVLDLNHPLAGQTLTFDVEIVDVSSE